MGSLLAEKDFLYIGLGVGALYLILKNSKAIGGTIAGAASVVNPLLEAAGKGAAIVTDPQSYKPYTLSLLEAPFTSDQGWRLFKQEPGIATGINAVFTSLGLWK